MSKADEKLARLRSNTRDKIHNIERTMVLSGAGIALGAAEGAGKLPVAVAGIPTKLALGVVGFGIAAFASGTVSRTAKNIGDTCIAVYSYQAGKTKNVIAGDDDDYE